MATKTARVQLNLTKLDKAMFETYKDKNGDENTVVDLKVIIKDNIGEDNGRGGKKNTAFMIQENIIGRDMVTLAGWGGLNECSSHSVR